VIVVLLQDYTVPDFDPRTHLLSQLSLGRWGWVQIVNFVLAGVLNVFYAIGLRRRLDGGTGGTAAPIVIGLYGLFLVIVGVFKTDPANGFPPGAGSSVQPSGHAVIHALGGLFTFLTLTAGLVVFARLFFSLKRSGFACYCATSAALMMVCFFGGIHDAIWMARTLRLATLIGWMAASVVAMRLCN
jgi:hypothetical protein